MWRLPDSTLALPWVQDAPLATTTCLSDEDAGRKDICRVAACCSEAGTMGSVPQLVDIGGDMETHQRESLPRGRNPGGTRGDLDGWDGLLGRS